MNIAERIGTASLIILGDFNTELRGKPISFSSYKKNSRKKEEKEQISSMEYLEGNLSSAILDEIKNLKRRFI